MQMQFWNLAAQKLTGIMLIFLFYFFIVQCSENKLKINITPYGGNF